MDDVDTFGGNQGGAAARGQVDRLIERGLERYGLGDVDGALLIWEEALALDPEDVRAAAYVDYVRENYELLLQASRAGEEQVPFGLGAVPGEDEYEVEVTRGGTDAPADGRGELERYLDAVDDGWFLDDEPAGASASAAGDEVTGSYTPAPPFADSPDPDLDLVDPPPPGLDELDLGPPGLGFDLDPAAAPPAAEPGRPSLRHLPLPASADDDGDAAADAEDGPGITLEIEADEPDEPDPYDRADLAAAAGPAAPTAAPEPGDDELTGDFGVRRLGADALELDFADQRSAVPTREVQAPRGFVRLPGVPPPAAEPDLGDDDRLRTRPGHVTGGPIDRLTATIAPEALADFGGGTATGAGRVGPDERTRESPPVRVTFAPDADTPDVPPPREARSDDDAGELDLDAIGLGGAGEYEERTTERVSMRADTMGEPTLERDHRFPGVVSPAPLDEAPRGGDADAHPPLVIIEDPVLAGATAGASHAPDDDPADPEPFPSARETPTAEHRHRARTVDPSQFAALGEDELDPGTQRQRRPSAPVAAAAPSPTDRTALEELTARIDEEAERGAPPVEGDADRTRRRVGALLERAAAASAAGDHPTAILAVDLALAEDPDSAIAQKLLHRHQPAILDVYQRYLGDLSRCPALAMPMHELSGENLDIRAAFLLSRIDGSLSFEEILDVSGMQRVEAFRHLSLLLLRGILEVDRR